MLFAFGCLKLFWDASFGSDYSGYNQLLLLNNNYLCKSNIKHVNVLIVLRRLMILSVNYLLFKTESAC